MAFNVTITDYDPANYPLADDDPANQPVYGEDGEEIGPPPYQRRPSDPTELTFYPETGLQSEIGDETHVSGPASALLAARSGYVPAGAAWTFYTEEDFKGEAYPYNNDSQIARVLDFDPQCGSVIRGTTI
ncbi:MULTISPECIES: hypothetical protein [Streptacidiphilus]|uniref:Uncharacterized protein n=1 Tax=Streptacidiphilus cavernicola TaxID=3342716 RepID=A0ABV6UPE4_9ACTN|nr:hypothetical protein [Streptacidiphilus jeojiense]